MIILCIHCNECFSHELSPIFSRQLPRIRSRELLPQPNDPIESFHDKIQQLLLSTFIDSTVPRQLAAHLENMAQEHPFEAKEYWDLNKIPVLSVAETMCAQASIDARNPDDEKNAQGISHKLLHASLNRGFLEAFEALIKNELIKTYKSKY